MEGTQQQPQSCMQRANPQPQTLDPDLLHDAGPLVVADVDQQVGVAAARDAVAVVVVGAPKVLGHGSALVLLGHLHTRSSDPWGFDCGVLWGLVGQ